MGIMIYSRELGFVLKCNATGKQAEKIMLTLGLAAT